MPEPHRSVLGSLALIAIVIGAAAALVAYTAGWFSPERLTPTRLVDALAPSDGPSLGHRRNHAKGICFTGVFEANGAGSELSKAQVFARGHRALQSCYRRCERAGCDGPRARIGNTYRDAGRPGMA
jgi:catalase